MLDNRMVEGGAILVESHPRSMRVKLFQNPLIHLGEVNQSFFFYLVLALASSCSAEQFWERVNQETLL